MGALLGVGQGSAQESKLVVIKYQGDKKGVSPIALVGKGLTFDTGGISIKPSGNMDRMKYDMAGSAAVVGTIKALALRGAKINVVGVVGLVENMPGHDAQRPGDIVTTMSGKTVEVLNTDAEGRLVLADALWYVQSKFRPKLIIDLATLTGAIVVALGSTYAGCFSNDQGLVNELKIAGEETGDKIWHMPLDKDYEEMMKSHIADIANISKCHGEAGSSTAAQFLKYFVKDGTKWAHLDIAGVAYNKKSGPKCIEGGNGFGVALLNRLISKFYESDSDTTISQ
jgi:leucyl aminopeptidase